MVFTVRLGELIKVSGAATSVSVSVSSRSRAYPCRLLEHPRSLHRWRSREACSEHLFFARHRASSWAFGAPPACSCRLYKNFVCATDHLTLATWLCHAICIIAKATEHFHSSAERPVAYYWVLTPLVRP